MVAQLLLRGMIIGFLAGMIVFVFAHSFGEPLIDGAIAFECTMARAAGKAPEPEIVARATQAGLGLFSAVVVYSTAAGGLFSLIFSFLYGRANPCGAHTTSALLGLAAFLVISLIPDFKYPANPPAVGSADTIGARTVLYFVMLLGSIVALSLAVAMARSLARKFGVWNAAIILGLLFAITDYHQITPSGGLPLNKSTSVFDGIVPARGEIPDFAPGDRVNISDRVPIGHYRMPTYLRGKRGTVETVIQPMAVNNEQEAYGHNSGSKGYYYRVSIPMTEIWANYTGSPRDSLLIEIFEDWLEGNTTNV